MTGCHVIAVMFANEVGAESSYRWEYWVAKMATCHTTVHGMDYDVSDIFPVSLASRMRACAVRWLLTRHLRCLGKGLVLDRHLCLVLLIGMSMLDSNLNENLHRERVRVRCGTGKAYRSRIFTIAPNLATEDVADMRVLSRAPLLLGRSVMSRHRVV